MDEHKPIMRFKDKVKHLSNKSPHITAYRGRIFPSVEVAFKTVMNEDAERNKSSPEEMIKIMRELVDSKFFLNIDARNALLSTGIRELFDGNRAGTDLFWGFDIKTWTGENKLGEIIASARFFIRYTNSRGSCAKCPAYVCNQNSCDCMLRLHYGDETFYSNLKEGHEDAIKTGCYICPMRAKAWSILTKDFRKLFYDTYPIYFNPNKIWIDLEDLGLNFPIIENEGS